MLRFSGINAPLNEHIAVLQVSILDYKVLYDHMARVCVQIISVLIVIRCRIFFMVLLVFILMIVGLFSAVDFDQLAELVYRLLIPRSILPISSLHLRITQMLLSASCLQHLNATFTAKRVRVIKFRLWPTLFEAFAHLVHLAIYLT